MAPASSGDIYYYVDHTSTCPVNSGVQRVTRALGRTLMAAGQKVTPVGWRSRESALARVAPHRLLHMGKWNGPRFPWKVLDIPLKKDTFDIFLKARGMYWRVPLHEDPTLDSSLNGRWLLIPEVTHITRHASNPTESVVRYARAHGMHVAFVFYDALPLRYDLYRAMREAHRSYMQGILDGDLIFAISEASAEDLRSFASANGAGAPGAHAEIQVCPLPGEFLGVERERRVLSKTAGPIRILSVGSIDERKNQVLLVRAFESLVKEAPEINAELTLVGGLSTESRHAIRAALSDKRIRFAGVPDDMELVELYRAATFTVFPSLDEGFGLPIAESLWFGKPCICASWGSMREIAASGGCLMVDARDVVAMKHALRKLCVDDEFRTTLAHEAVSRPIRTWNEYASAILEQFARMR